MNEFKPVAAETFIKAIHDTETYPCSVLVSADFDNSIFDPTHFARSAVYCPPPMFRASRKRQAEYFAGRYLANEAMSSYGTNQFKLIADAKRCPQWPSTLVGSITHTDRYAACIVAKKSAIAAIGIDAQDILNDSRAERVQSRIIDSVESRLIAQSELTPALGVSLCFSAKEAIYKALYPLVQQYFGFNAAKLHSINTIDGHLTFRFDPALWILYNERNTLTVQYQIKDQRLLSCVMLNAVQK
ncbi:4'-phosphopantetheinyl transferase family protein [Zhongshania sp.]|jgi:enterobactin synthetase component D|uniref:4'-phosphopantetheinyl transferase family protein n=1 Tax=Zhongshania sp. TaxID=1971902 RepID=UPI0039E354F5